MPDQLRTNPTRRQEGDEESNSVWESELRKRIALGKSWGRAKTRAACGLFLRPTPSHTRVDVGLAGIGQTRARNSPRTFSTSDHAHGRHGRSESVFSWEKVSPVHVPSKGMAGFGSPYFLPAATVRQVNLSSSTTRLRQPTTTTTARWTRKWLHLDLHLTFSDLPFPTHSAIQPPWKNTSLLQLKRSAPSRTLHPQTRLNFNPFSTLSTCPSQIAPQSSQLSLWRYHTCTSSCKRTKPRSSLATIFSTISGNF